MSAAGSGRNGSRKVLVVLPDRDALHPVRHRSYFPDSLGVVLRRYRPRSMTADAAYVEMMLLRRAAVGRICLRTEERRL